MKLKNHSILTLIVLIGIFLRFFMLGGVPNGLYQDETAIGYNAYSILQTGKDEYGKSYPLYFKSFGDQKLPVYIYATAISVKLFGMTPFAVRFPSAFFGVLSIIVLYYFIRDLTKNEKIALLSSFFLAINPWSLHYNRATFEVSISLFLFILGGYLLRRFFVQKTQGAFFVGTICFVLSLYSYNLTRLLSPVLFAFFIFENKKEIKNAKKTEVIIASVFAILCLIPFFLNFFKSGGVASASGTLITSSAITQAPLQELRIYMLNLPFGFVSLFFNKYIQTLWHYMNNLASYFSVEFFFIKGSLHGNHGIGNVGLFYLFELPLMVSGLVYMIRRKTSGIVLLIGWAAIAILIASFTREVPHATRSFFLLVPLTVFLAAGVLYFHKLILGIKGSLKYGLLIGCLLIVFYNLIYYFSSYYVRFPVLYAKPWRVHDRELAYYLGENEKNYKKIIIDADFMYTSLLFYTKYSPAEFQKTAKRLPDDPEGFSKVTKFGKYEFRAINWDEDTKIENALLISSQENSQYKHLVIKKFFYPERPIAIPKDQIIYTTTVRESSYVLIKTI